MQITKGRRMARKKSITVALILISILLAGCTGENSEGGSSSEDSTLVREAFYIEIEDDEVFVELCKDPGLYDCREKWMVHSPQLDFSSDLNDRISSLELHATREYSLALCKHPSYHNRDQECRIIHGSDRGTVRLQIEDLKDMGLNDEISQIIWYKNGSQYSGAFNSGIISDWERVCDVRCRASYVELYRDPDYQDRFGGARLDLINGGTILIRRDGLYHDSISSIRVNAPSNVAVELCVDHITENPNTRCHRFPGGGDIGYNINRLKQYGVEDNVSTIRWYVIDDNNNFLLIGGRYSFN